MTLFVLALGKRLIVTSSIASDGRVANHARRWKQALLKHGQTIHINPMMTVSLLLKNRIRCLFWRTTLRS